MAGLPGPTGRGTWPGHRWICDSGRTWWRAKRDRVFTYTGSQPPCPGGGDNAELGSKTHGLEWIDDQGQMVVNWPLHYPQGKQVLMTFTQVDYTRLNNEAYQPVEISF